MTHSEFQSVLDRIIRNQEISSEELTDLALFIAGGGVTEAQRSGIIIALGMRYLERFRKT